MRVLWCAFGHFLAAAFRGRLFLQLEIVALRHQLSVYERSRPQRFRLEPGDRVLWSWLARLWPQWRDRVRFVRPRTVLEWQKRRFRDHWRRKSECRPGRPAVDPEIRALIRKISRAQSKPGLSSHRRRARQGRHRRREVHGREVSRPRERLSVADVEDISRDAREGPGLHRLLRRADGEIRDSVCPDRSGPRAPQARSFST